MCALFCGQSFGQGPAMVNASVTPDSLPSAPMAQVAVPPAANEHRFWDRGNLALFATVAALNAADFAVTRSNLQNGGQELNPITRVVGRSTAGLAANFAAETASVIGVSYFLHKTSHHKLERIVSFVNVGGSAAAVTYGLTHR